MSRVWNRSATSYSHQSMVQVLERLSVGAEDKCVKAKVKRCITAVDGAMVVWTDQHKISEIIVATPAEPPDVVRFA